jgi:hypothetical protein
MRPPGHHVGIEYHRQMLADTVRMSAWDRAIRRAIAPGDVVLDAGAGTGIMAMLAARQGARVYAVESADVADIAERLIAANGLSERVTVVKHDLGVFTPPERVDWVLCDFVGRYLPDRAMFDLVGACAQWLKPSGRFMPGKVRWLAAAVGDFSIPQLDSFDVPLLGLDLGECSDQAYGVAYQSQLSGRTLLSQPQVLATATPPVIPARISEERTFVVERDGVLRGVAGWFDAALHDDIVVDTKPGVTTSWGQLVWPVRPRQVRAGDVVTFALDARTGESSPEFSWRITEGPEAAPRHRHAGACFDREALVEANRVGAEALMSGNVAAAIRTLSECVCRVPNDATDLVPVLHENLGLALLNGGRFGEAVSSFERALDGRLASREQSLRFLSHCLRQLGRIDEADVCETAYRSTFKGEE